MAVLLPLLVMAQRVVLPGGGDIPFEQEMIQAMKSDVDTLFISSPGTPIISGPIRIDGARNKVILFEENTELKARAGAFPLKRNSLISLINCDSIALLGNGNTLSMNKSEYVEGEWRHVLNIRGSSHITIQDLVLKESGGDGIYLAGSKINPYASHIRIDKISSLANKRQGISIISARDVHITNSIFAKTSGTFPGAGIDIEPNIAEDVVQGIRVEDCLFEENFHSGVILNLGKLKTKSEPVDIRFENCIIRNNHADENPKVATEILIRSAKENPVGGTVVFKNCLIEESKWGMLYARKHAAAFQVSFEQCFARNICSSGGLSAIGLEVLDYKTISNEIGGYRFDGLYLDYEASKPHITVRGSRLNTLKHFKDVTGKIIISDDGVDEIDYINYNPNSNLNVELEFIRQSPKPE